ncbi:MAG: TonB-dependent receptor [Cycloclasticus sp.]
MNFKTSYTLPLFLLSQAALADNSVLGHLDAVTVTATKLTKSISQMTQSVTVIDESDIEEQAFNDFTEVLRQVPGIEFKQAGGPGQFSYIKLRGFSAGNILFVLDGVIMNQGSTGDARHLMGQIDPNSIERVEVLRGPQAALYGANSTAGVIAITSKSGKQRNINMAVETGSLDWNKARVSIRDNQQLAGGELQYALNWSKTDGGGVHKHEFFKDHTIQGKLDYLTDTIDVGINYFRSDNKFAYAELDEPYAALSSKSDHWSFQTPDPHQDSRSVNDVVSAYLTQRINDQWQHKLRLSKTDTLYHTVDLADGFLGNQLAPFNNFSFEGATYNAGDVIAINDRSSSRNTMSTGESLQANYELIYAMAELQLLVGAEYFDASAKTDRVKQGDSKHHSLYTNAEYAVGDSGLVLAMGLRADEHEAWGSQLSGSIGASYTVAQQSVFGNISSSFRAPTLSHLYNSKYGNEGVTPEEGETIELGFRQTLLQGDANWELTLWKSELDDVIFFDSSIINPLSYNGFGKYNNGDKQRTQGVELSGVVYVNDRLSFNANYTYTDSWIKKNGEWDRTVQIARNKANLALRYDLEGLVLNANLYYAGPRLRWKGDVEMDAYTRADVSARYPINDNFHVYGRLENLFDEEIEEGLGYEQPGRYGVLGLEYSLN